MMNLSQKLGSELLKARTELGYTQEQMAEQCGVTPRHYNNMEQGGVVPRLDTALRLHRVAGIDLYSLPCQGAEEQGDPGRK